MMKKTFLREESIDKIFAMIAMGILLSITILIGTTFANPVFANEYHPDNECCMRPDYREMLNQLELSKDQKNQVMALIQDFKKDIKPYRQTLVKTRIRVLKEMISDQLSESQTRSLLKEASSSKEELIIARIKMVGEIKKIMNPAQAKKLKELQEDHWTKMKENAESHIKETL